MTTARGSASDRLEQARAEIARRRQLAESATPGGWVAMRPQSMGSAAGDVVSMSPHVWIAASSGYPIRRADADHIAANDPAHVLAVLAAADATLDRHAPESDVPLDEDVPWCRSCPDLIEGDGTHLTWPCPDAAAVLNLYAPEVRGG